MRFFVLGLIGLIGVGCHPRFLQIRSDFLTPAYLGGEQIDTPDPRRHCFYGEQVVVRWVIPKRYLGLDPTLELTVRYGDRTIESFRVSVRKTRGFWVYQLTEERYSCKGGILSYKAEIFTDSEVIARWQHHIWADRIAAPDEF
ncbi:MAG: hypothetical protein KDK55_00080 [Chlamydiia bacterium]|nr:hypothetical protein [Chlamydiia bacterium]